MGKRVTVVLDYPGVGELLKSDAVKELISSHAEAIANRAGEGYVASTKAGKRRIQGRVSADSEEAYFDNLENNTLAKSIK